MLDLIVYLSVFNVFVFVPPAPVTSGHESSGRRSYECTSGRYGNLSVIHQNAHEWYNGLNSGVEVADVV